MSTEGPRHSDDFAPIYHHDDPRPYFRPLNRCGYRAPGYIASVLAAGRDALRRARAVDGPVRIADFGSGFGAIGAQLHHGCDLDEVYAYYEEGAWSADAPRALRSVDVEHWRRRRDAEPRFEIGGIDIAGPSIEYGLEVGFLDHGFTDDLTTTSPSPALARFLADCDIVVESGAIATLLPPAFARIADSAARRPWFLASPRRDVDPAALERTWEMLGYRAVRIGREPFAYRRPLSAAEHAELVDSAAAFGRRETDVVRGGYLLADATFAAPTDDPGAAVFIEFLEGLSTEPWEVADVA